MSDPSIPTYASGTIALMSTDVISDSATNTTGSTTALPQLRAVAVGTSNADYNNWALSKGTPAAFPGLQT